MVRIMHSCTGFNLSFKILFAANRIASTVEEKFEGSVKRVCVGTESRREVSESVETCSISSETNYKRNIVVVSVRQSACTTCAKATMMLWKASCACSVYDMDIKRNNTAVLCGGI